jgi:hypothetical protein
MGTTANRALQSTKRPLHHRAIWQDRLKAALRLGRRGAGN